MTTRISKLALATALAIPAAVHAWDWRWSWRMPDALYKNQDFTLRAGIDRATRITAEAVDGNRGAGTENATTSRFRAALAEWRKVQVQAESENFDEELLGYVTFMQGLCREGARDGNEAIKIYDETAELYSDIPYLYAKARYRRACAYLAMGEERRGRAAMEELAGDETADGWPDTADAIMSCAWQRWQSGDPAGAKEMYRRVLTDAYRTQAKDQWNSTRRELVFESLVTGDYSDFEDFVFAGVDETDDEARRSRIDEACNMRYRTLVAPWEGDFSGRTERLFTDRKKRDEKALASRKAFLAWMTGRRDVFARLKREYNFEQLRLLATFGTGDAKAVDAQFAKCLEYIGTLFKGDPARGDRDINWLVDRAMDVRMTEKADELAYRISDPFASTWKRWELARRTDRWKIGEQALKEYLDRKPDAAGERNAKGALAWLYAYPTGRHEDAIKLYLDLNDPPGTLWELVRLYRITGKKGEAYRILGEIASIFENEAPEAIWRMACYREEDGEKKQAIALYRRLLSQPEWKKSQQSSRAHQALERLGIATGGAVTAEVH